MKRYSYNDLPETLRARIKVKLYENRRVKDDEFFSLVVLEVLKRGLDI